MLTCHACSRGSADNEEVLQLRWIISLRDTIQFIKCMFSIDAKNIALEQVRDTVLSVQEIQILHPSPIYAGKVDGFS